MPTGTTLVTRAVGHDEAYFLAFCWGCLVWNVCSTWPLFPCILSPTPQTQQQKFVNWQCDAEYRGDDFTAAVTLGNPDVLVGSGTGPFKMKCS